MCVRVFVCIPSWLTWDDWQWRKELISFFSEAVPVFRYNSRVFSVLLYNFLGTCETGYQKRINEKATDLGVIRQRYTVRTVYDGSVFAKFKCRPCHSQKGGQGGVCSLEGKDQVAVWFIGKKINNEGLWNWSSDILIEHHWENFTLPDKQEYLEQSRRFLFIKHISFACKLQQNHMYFSENLTAINL